MKRRAHDPKNKLPMPAWLAVLIEDLRASFWAVPAVMVALALLAAFTFPALDRNYLGEIHGGIAGTMGLWFDGKAEGARLLLGTVAGSALTVAGVVFSITIATLSMAAGQYGPRLLRQFIADRGNQFTLGTFLGTFTYCLVVLRAMPDGDFGDTYMPRLSVTWALLLALLSIGVLIWFIHHIAESMQPARLVADVGHALDAALESAHTNRIGDPIDVEPDEAFDADDADMIRSSHIGYVEAIAFRELFNLAVKHDLKLQLLVRPGTYVFEKTALMRCHPEARADEKLRDRLQHCIRVSSDRTLAQDVEFGMDQLSEMAIRALSPGINDPRTAMICINRLGAALAKECVREPIDRVRGKDGTPRLVLQVSTFERLLGGAFNGIRHAARDSFGVQLRLIEVLTMIGRAAVTRSQQQSILQMIQLVRATASENRLNADLVALQDRCDEAASVLRGDTDEEESYRE